MAYAILYDQAQVELDGTVTPVVIKEEVEVEVEPVKIVELVEVVKSNDDPRHCSIGHPKQSTEEWLNRNSQAKRKMVKLTCQANLESQKQKQFFSL